MRLRRGGAVVLLRAGAAGLLGGALALGAIAPAHADPGEVPDAGARPAPAGEVPLPDGSSSRLPAGDGPDGPLAGQIAEVEAEIGTVVLELRRLEPQLADATGAREHAEEEWRTAEQARIEAEHALAALVTEAYQGAAAVLPELTGLPLRDLARHAPRPVDSPLGGEAAGRQLLRAEEAADLAAATLDAARDAELALDGRVRGHEAELASLQARLEDLRERNAAALAAQEAEEQRRAQAGSFPLLDSPAGLQPGEAALQAVEFALQQLGKPYLWGAQGPDRYDCSGLVWDAYRSVGITVPRVAADQYHGTRANRVARHALLPGDLVFFSRSSTDWRQIHHVGIYVGDGRMVHAPNSNEVVKVSPVWWSRFFGATRVVDAVEVEPSPSPSPSPTTPPATPPATPPTTPPASPTTPPPASPTTVAVPTLSGTAEEAEHAIRRAGLVPEAGPPDTSTCPTPGQVVNQDPAAGVQVPQGSTVTYVICEPAIPDVRGWREPDARATLADLSAVGFSFTVEAEYAPSEDHDPGTVLDVLPPVGTPAATVDTVTLTVVGVAVPDLTDETVAEATRLLDEAQLDWEFQDGDEQPAEPDGADPVVSQKPARGEVLRLGSTVVIVV